MILGLVMSIEAIQTIMTKLTEADLTPKREIVPIVIELPKPGIEDWGDEDETVEETERPIKMEPIEMGPITGIGDFGSPTNPIPVPKPIKPKLEVM